MEDRKISGDGDFDVSFENVTNGQRKVTVTSKSGKYIHVPSATTSYDDETLLAIIGAKGYSYLCDEVLREQDPTYVKNHLVATIAAHVDPEDLAGKRMLDFGCGAGASTVALSQFLPHVEIVGVELDESNLAAARARMKFYGITNAILQLSPAGDKLPDGIGTFDAIMLPAVYEHLLPAEREQLLPMLWSILRPGGHFFLDETPWRWFPIETHTTGLPLINYLPASVALRYARLSKRISDSATWPGLLRGGIRGGAISTITKQLGEDAALLKPYREGVEDYIALWKKGYLQGHQLTRAKKLTGSLATAVHSITGVAAVPYLSLAWQKRAG